MDVQGMIPWSPRLLTAVVASVALISGITAFVALGPPPGGRPPPGEPQHWVAFSEPQVGGEPGQNTTEIWVASISNVSSEEPFSMYEAGLFRNGDTLVAPVPLHPGLLGTSGDLLFEFFDYGAMCIPSPCPPPLEEPDGLLNPTDYFRLTWVDAGASYVIRVYWAPTDQVAGEITVDT